jgi:hypothetical protein
LKKNQQLERDQELENIVGNLMIARYQVDKLRSRLGEMIGGEYGSASYKKTSVQAFKHDGKWYKISIKSEVSLVNDDNDNDVKKDLLI